MIEMRLMPKMTVEEWSDKHNVKIIVQDRGPLCRKDRYYAKLDGVEIMDGGMLRSSFSNGETPDDAIAGLWEVYTGHRLVTGAYTPNRREYSPTDFVKNL